MHNLPNLFKIRIYPKKFIKTRAYGAYSTNLGSDHIMPSISAYLSSGSARNRWFERNMLRKEK